MSSAPRKKMKAKLFKEPTATALITAPTPSTAPSASPTAPPPRPPPPVPGGARQTPPPCPESGAAPAAEGGVNRKI